VASTQEVTLVHAHPKRGREGIDAGGVLPKVTGVLVHDAWASYDKRDNVLAHQLCNFHRLRDWQAVIDYYTTHPACCDPHLPGWCWAAQAYDALMAIKTATDAAPDHLCPPQVLATNKTLLVSALVIGQVDDDRSPPGKVGARYRAWARHYQARLDDYLRFATTPGLPFGNNMAERDIRGLKIKIKAAGALRSAGGADVFALLGSYIATCAKNTINVFTALIDALAGHPYLPGLPA
jgi:hypothetical protein